MMKYFFLFLVFLCFPHFAFSQEDNVWFIRNSDYTSDSCIFKRKHAVCYNVHTGALTGKGRTNLFGKAGRWKLRGPDGKTIVTKYKYGQPKDSLYTKEGKRKLVYFVYGFGHGPGDAVEEDSGDKKYAMMRVGIGYCMVTRRTAWRAAYHNFFNDGIQCLRWGIHWKKEYYHFQGWD